MKESKFIELLNLYVDHEISAEEAALLEAEVQRNPERHRIYREYCQMQRACTMLAESGALTAPEPEVSKVVAFPAPQRRVPVWAAYAGGLAAAACLALVFVGRQNVEPVESAPAIAAVEQTQPTPAATERVELQPAFSGLLQEMNEPKPLLANRGAAPALDWMKRVQLQTVPVDQLRFSTPPTFQPSDLSLRKQSDVSPEAEMTAFRFQR